MLTVTKHILRARPQLSFHQDYIDSIAKYGEYEVPTNYQPTIDTIRASILDQDDNPELFYLQDPRQVISIFRRRLIDRSNAIYSCNMLPTWASVWVPVFGAGLLFDSMFVALSGGAMICCSPAVHRYDKRIQANTELQRKVYTDILDQIQNLELEFTTGVSPRTEREMHLIAKQKSMYDLHLLRERQIEEAKRLRDEAKKIQEEIKRSKQSSE